MTPHLIAVDWGTTSLRCYLVSDTGRILDQRTSKDGIMAIPDRRFGPTLAEAIAPWQQTPPSPASVASDPETPPLPILMSGMIGSRQGWHEAPYVPCPATLQAVASNLLQFTDPALQPILGSVTVVPGLSTQDEIGSPDVIRGEETQIFGVIAAHQDQDAPTTIVLPGTHAKWATVADGAITRFQTYMTGEVYAALRTHTILSRLIEGDAHNEEAFLKGVAASEGPTHLLSRIFSTRALTLFDALPPTDAASYLSGLLIGTEIRAATAAPSRSSRATAQSPIAIIANSELVTRYRLACTTLGVATVLIDEATIVHGHLALAREAGLVAPRI